MTTALLYMSLCSRRCAVKTLPTKGIVLPSYLASQMCCHNRRRTPRDSEDRQVIMYDRRLTEYFVAIGTHCVLCVIEDQTRPSRHIDFCQPLAKNTKN